jgi:gamma-glutamylcyclotransferase (GGCT)/AIG2-like uncharacterized protein YtfP
MKVAVYGTLREGYNNNGVLGESVKIGLGWTKDKYQMSANGIPFVHPNIELSPIRVEVYEVTPAQMPMVDRLESYNPQDHDGSWYKRVPTEITLDDGEDIEASVYFNEDEGVEIIKTGNYADYR